MNERRRPLPGIAKLSEMERRAKHEAQRTPKPVGTSLVSPVEDRAVDPYPYFDDRKKRKQISEVISRYIDTINNNQKKKNDIYDQWHRQDDGRLSKNIQNRQKYIARRFWEKTLN